MSNKTTPEEIEAWQNDLYAAAMMQDEYDLCTVNLIAPASPTNPRYCDELPLRHNAIIEGLLGHRPYAGAAGFNAVESIAVSAARSLFCAEHANVQPHSVSQANQAVYAALLEPGDAVLAMKFDAGGHLTHGLDKNFSGKTYDFSFYGVDATGRIDYDEMSALADRFKPKLIVTGASSYPRTIDFETIREIAQGVGAKVLADLSHPAGLVAAGRFPQPFPHCDVVTLTPDKTMLGGHGGIILSKAELAKPIDSAVHPGTQSSVPLRRIYGLAQCLIDAHKPHFAAFIDRVLGNMKAIESRYSHIEGLMVTGGSDTHLMVIDTLNTFGLTGNAAEALLESINILTNRQVIPGETQKPYIASGVRLGTTWSTARGFSVKEMGCVADTITSVLREPQNLDLKANARQVMAELALQPRPEDIWN